MLFNSAPAQILVRSLFHFHCGNPASPASLRFKLRLLSLVITIPGTDWWPGGVVLGMGGTMLDAGTRFVKFELAAHDGSTVRSSDLEGTAYLLYFYPKASTPG